MPWHLRSHSGIGNIVVLFWINVGCATASTRCHLVSMLSNEVFVAFTEAPLSIFPNSNWIPWNCKIQNEYRHCSFWIESYDKLNPLVDDNKIRHMEQDISFRLLSELKTFPQYCSFLRFSCLWCMRLYCFYYVSEIGTPVASLSTIMQPQCKKDNPNWNSAYFEFYIW